MKLVIDISEYDREWIKNTFGIPQDIDVAIAQAIINGTPISAAHGNPVAFHYRSVCKEHAYADEEGKEILSDFCPH